MPTPGLIFVTSKVIDPSKTSDEKYNQFYNDEHLPQVLNHGVTKVGLRYKNVNPAAERRYLALYPLDDTSYLGSEGSKQFVQDTRKSRTFDGGDIYDYIEFGIRPYAKIQTFEGFEQEHKSGRDRGATLVCVAMDPADGQEQDFDDWYRKQHLDMLSMCKGYRRSTRYERTDGAKPRYLALHEYDCPPDQLPSDQIKIVTSSEWSKKIIGQALSFDRDVFELIQAQGDTSLKL